MSSSKTRKVCTMAGIEAIVPVPRLSTERTYYVEVLGLALVRGQKL